MSITTEELIFLSLVAFKSDIEKLCKENGFEGDQVNSDIMRTSLTHFLMAKANFNFAHVIEYNSGWIDVDDRMPDEGRHVIIAIEDPDGIKTPSEGYYLGGEWVKLEPAGIEAAEDEIYRVTYWRPFPDPNI